jgi:hypothetical protein
MVEFITDMQGVGIVDRDAELQVIAYSQDVREKGRVTYAPVIVILGFIADETPFYDAIIGEFEADLVVVRTSTSRTSIPRISLIYRDKAVHLPPTPVMVQPLEV